MGQMWKSLFGRWTNGERVDWAYTIHWIKDHWENTIRHTTLREFCVVTPILLHSLNYSVNLFSPWATKDAVVPIENRHSLKKMDRQEKKSVNLRVEIGMASGWNRKDLESLLGKIIPLILLSVKTNIHCDRKQRVVTGLREMGI